MKQTHHIDFLLVANIEGMHFQPHRPKGIRFIPTGGSGSCFTLVPSDPHNDACGHRGGLDCKVYATHLATDEQSLFVDSYNNQNVMLRVSDGITLPFQPRDEVLISTDGVFKDGFHPRRHLCPQDIVDLIERAESELASSANRFLKLLRWRQAIDSPGEFIRHQSLYWRVDDGEYHLCPLDGGPSQELEVPAMYGIHWEEEHQHAFQEIWSANDLIEPLGHTLLREAVTLASESPRSAILIMAAALETAIKMHISRIAPDTAWLMQEVSSPPIFKILRDYIPIIHLVRGNELDYWDKVKPFIKKIQTLIELRNKVAHTGKIPEDASPINDDLVLVRDILYLLDVLDGHDWAKSLVSHAFRKALNWPNPSEGRLVIRLKLGY